MVFSANAIWLKEDCWDGLDFSNWDQLESWDDKASIELLDTTNFSIENVARKFADWINRKPYITNLINDKVYNVLKNVQEQKTFMRNWVLKLAMKG